LRQAGQEGPARGLGGATGYAIEELPRNCACKLIQLDIGQAIWSAKRQRVAFNFDEANWYLRFRAGNAID
jgi:hypothetical protein